jgi:hypothetical protein
LDFIWQAWKEWGALTIMPILTNRILKWGIESVFSKFFIWLVHWCIITFCAIIAKFDWRICHLLLCLPNSHLGSFHFLFSKLALAKLACKLLISLQQNSN